MNYLSSKVHIVLLMLFCANVLNGQPTIRIGHAEGVIVGKILDSLTRQPISDVLIRIDSIGSLLGSSDSLGYYKIDHIPEGQHILHVVNYFHSYDRKYPVTIHANDTTYYDFNIVTDDEYNAELARKDIAQGIVKIKEGGIEIADPFPPWPLFNKYGFEYENVSVPMYGYWDSYNAVVLEYLDRRNGKGWNQKFKKEYIEWYRVHRAEWNRVHKDNH